jgi:predicted enzyme related to lactoylglutathione lyase
VFLVWVDEINTVVERAKELSGRVVQEPRTAGAGGFALIADSQGHVVGLAHSRAETPLWASPFGSMPYGRAR